MPPNTRTVNGANSLMSYAVVHRYAEKTALLLCTADCVMALFVATSSFFAFSPILIIVLYGMNMTQPPPLQIRQNGLVFRGLLVKPCASGKASKTIAF